MWWHYQEMLWVQRTGDKFPEWPDLHPLLLTSVCLCSSFPQPTHILNTHILTKYRTQCTHASTLQPHKNVRFAFMYNTLMDTHGCTISYRRKGWHSLIYLYHELLSCLYVLFHPAVTVITPHISPPAMPSFTNPDGGGMSVTTPSLCIMVVQLQTAGLETCWAAKPHLSSSSPHYTDWLLNSKHQHQTAQHVPPSTVLH